MSDKASSAGGATGRAAELPDQVRLPLRLAIGVVLQGIRIRFGRSVITLLGVTLGIAFLMAILAGQALKRGVGDEDRLRAETQRMHNFLLAEMGPASGRPLAVILLGPPSEMELRLMRHLQDEGAELRIASPTGAALPPNRLRASAPTMEPAAAAAGASAVLVAGEAPATLPAVEWDGLLASAQSRLLALGRDYTGLDTEANVTRVRLARDPQPEEIGRLEAEQRRSRVRNIWITVIALLVTVMGISNAMLMSVTERFREIGTMKCLGALSSFVRRMFLIEATLAGLVGGALGIAAGLAATLAGSLFTYGAGLTWVAVRAQAGGVAASTAAVMAAAVVLSALAAIYPAGVAARMIPANALRSNV